MAQGIHRRKEQLRRTSIPSGQDASIAARFRTMPSTLNCPPPPIPLANLGSGIQRIFFLVSPGSSPCTRTVLPTGTAHRMPPIFPRRGGVGIFDFSGSICLVPRFSFKREKSRGKQSQKELIGPKQNRMASQIMGGLRRRTHHPGRNLEVGVAVPRAGVSYLTLCVGRPTR